MREFEVGADRYRTRDLGAYQQHRLLRTIGPALPAIDAIDLSLVANGGTLAFDGASEALGSASSESIAALYEACASACERWVDDAWEPATKAVPLLVMQAIVRVVVEVNFTAYFAVPRPKFSVTRSSGADFTPVGARRGEVGLPDGDDWFFRPVEANMIPFIGAYDGSHRIEHFAMANAILDVRYENEARARKAAERA